MSNADIGRKQVSVSLADLWTVYEYARHFDCDDDPSMIRVRKVIKDGAS